MQAPYSRAPGEHQGKKQGCDTSQICPQRRTPNNKSNLHIEHFANEIWMLNSRSSTSNPRALNSRYRYSLRSTINSLLGPNSWRNLDAGGNSNRCSNRGPNAGWNLSQNTRARCNPSRKPHIGKGHYRDLNARFNPNLRGNRNPGWSANPGWDSDCSGRTQTRPKK